jgi:hypothetical protein
LGITHFTLPQSSLVFLSDLSDNIVMSVDPKFIKDDDETARVSPIAGLRIYRPEVDTSGLDERKLLRKIDWHVVPWLAVLYLLNFLDRGNIGNARVCAESLNFCTLITISAFALAV